MKKPNVRLSTRERTAEPHVSMCSLAVFSRTRRSHSAVSTSRHACVIFINSIQLTSLRLVYLFATTPHPQSLFLGLSYLSAASLFLPLADTVSMGPACPPGPLPSGINSQADAVESDCEERSNKQSKGRRAGKDGVWVQSESFSIAGLILMRQHHLTNVHGQSRTRCLTP